MFLALLILIVALSLSGIAAYYSIIGLAAIFAAAVIPIIIMGGILEIAKLTVTVWLHQHWNRAKFLMKAYLVSAVAVLMFITSMGIFGFLSKSHIEQTSAGTEQIVQAEVIENKILRAQAKQQRWTDEIARLQAGETSGRVDALITRERERIKDARASLTPQIDAENAKVPGLRTQAEKEVAQQNKRLSDAQSRSADAIKVAQAELDRLDADVLAYTKQGQAKTGAFGGTTDMVAKGNELRKQQRRQRGKLQGDIDKAKSAEVSVASAVQREITKINNRLADQIKEVEARIADIRKTVEPTIASANENIAKYTTQAGSSNKDIDIRIDELENQIDELQPTIDTLREDKFVYEKQYRQFEAEVGPIKYIAELVYGADPDQNLLEEAVRWVIILIVAVFDPLAIMMLLAATETFGWRRKDKESIVDNTKTESVLPPAPVEEAPSGEQQTEESPDAATDQPGPEIEETGEQDQSDNQNPARVKVHVEHIVLPDPEQDLTYEEARAQVIEDNIPPVFDSPIAVPAEPLFPEHGTPEAKAFSDDIVAAAMAKQFGSKPESKIEEEVQDQIILEFMQPAQEPDNASTYSEITTAEQEETADLGEPGQSESTVEAETIEDSELFAWREEDEGDPEKRAKRIWKRLNLDSTLKEQEQLFDNKVIPEVPWTQYMRADDSDLDQYTRADFGTQFPTHPIKGDTFVRVDFLPSKLYKWNSRKWIEIDKNNTDAFTYNEEYIAHLIEKLGSGEYDPDLLNDAERAQIEVQLKNQEL